MYAVVDIETTGGSPNTEKITEIAIYLYDGEKVVDGFTRDNMCTLRLSRKLLPGHRSYSLGKLCGDLGIEIENRHRAAGDALATVKLLSLLLKRTRDAGQEDLLAQSISPNLKNLHPDLDKKTLELLPEESGVYYLRNDQNQVIYIGKSKNIRKRVLSHLSNNGSRRSIELKESIAGIDYELTGSELVALLVESSEIKKHIPRYNRAQKRKTMQYGLYSQKDEKGYYRLSIEKTANRINQSPETCFKNKAEAKAILSRLIERHWLCQKLCGMYDTDGACFHYGIRQCNGACIGKEPADIYNKRVMKALSAFYYQQKNMLIIDKGREEHEKSVIQLENGKYIGFGFLNTETSYLQMEDITDCIRIYEDNRDVQQIIRTYLNRHEVEKIIRY